MRNQVVGIIKVFYLLRDFLRRLENILFLGFSYPIYLIIAEQSYLIGEICEFLA